MAFYTCKQFSPVLNSPKHHCVLRVIFWDIGIRPVIISPDDNKGKRGENKTGANVSLYTSVCHFNHKTFVSGILLSHILEHHFPQLNRYWCHSFKNIMLEGLLSTCFHKTHPGSYDGTVTFGFTVVSSLDILPVYSGFSSRVVMK